MTFAAGKTGDVEALQRLAEDGGLIAYFGYGSLVNRVTHRTAIVAAVPARLHGWRRIWRPRPDMPGFPAALLTVRQEPGEAVDGLLVFDHADNLAAVDSREARYRRVELAADQIEGQVPAVDCPLYVYEADEKLPPHREAPQILRSYLDAVMQGFLVEHGDDGLRRFLAETDGFDTPIHEDREAPLYPRSVRLSQAERELFDRLLNETWPRPGN
ncbi:gamma-glutamylcyclotransferase family protein [Mesorhizobium xinjiangense]|uniref:gamma-glutamylcyclotransferase family protein n=1 Tax=Mesorhizobium xinjiangense TaxID=2678685 RepID=UPI0012EE4B60|nr:gamma-glutamylcyclotransferase family protein [Mesorhizobium xinjiangense]